MSAGFIGILYYSSTGRYVLDLASETHGRALPCCDDPNRIARSSKMSAGFHAGLNSEARDRRIAYKQSFLPKSRDSAKQESSSNRQRQPNWNSAGSAGSDRTGMCCGGNLGTYTDQQPRSAAFPSWARSGETRLTID